MLEGKNKENIEVLAQALDNMHDGKGYGQALIEGATASIVSRGKRKGALKASAPKYGTVGYIFYQAFVSAGSAYRMPSQCIMLFNEEQQAMFWAFHDVLSARQAALTGREPMDREQPYWNALKEVVLKANAA